MEFKVRDVDISTGDIFVCIMHKKDAHQMDLHLADRLSISKGKRSIIAVLDFAESSKLVKQGEIGLMEEVLKKLGVKTRDKVNIQPAEKPESIALIKKKLNGGRLTPQEITLIVNDVVANRLTKVELTYFVAGSYMNHMSLDETVALTKAMINSGDILKIDKYPIIDKHCIGGVPGNRTTMIVVPILVAAGYTMPKTSSRSITSPAGTADTMEVLSKVDHEISDIKRFVDKVGGCMVWGGAVNLAPADDKIITVEHPLSIDAESQLLASILAKKGSVSASHVLIDIPVGRGAKVKNMKKAVRLERLFTKIGKKLGMKIKVIITDGSQPIGNGIGPALEAKDVLWTLMNEPRAPKDLRDKALLMAGTIINLWPLKKEMKKKGFRIAKEILESGKAYEAMMDIIIIQGKKQTDPEKIRTGKLSYDIIAKTKGKVRYIDNVSIARIAKAAGAPNDKGAGIYLHKHVGDKVHKGERLFTIYADAKHKMAFAKDRYKLFGGFVVS